MNKIIDNISAQNIQRNFCVLGGEPLASENIFLTTLVVSNVREKYPDIQIWIWTGYEMEQLLEFNNPHLKTIFNLITGLVTGPFIFSQRDITLPMRGSRNQKIFIFDKKNNLCYNKENETEEYQL